MIELALLVIFLFLFVVIFFLFRNDNVYRIRTHFIDDESLWIWAYKELPDYDQMMYGHFDKWTVKQWIAWVENKLDKRGR